MGRPAEQLCDRRGSAALQAWPYLKMSSSSASYLSEMRLNVTKEVANIRSNRQSRNHTRHYIVIMCFGNFAAIKTATLQR
ncbi:MAG TPA: hypothetical protein VMU62_00245, partial [Acidobacteriaceae bacterium]|nr:hypothetical protein [Acidobacteriaceae bacterium]